MLIEIFYILEQADIAKAKAEGTLQVAERVAAALREANSAQQAAEDAIMTASTDIQVTQTHLTQVNILLLSMLLDVETNFLTTLSVLRRA